MRGSKAWHALFKLDNREVQLVLKEVPREDLILGMKTASEELRAKIFGNVSSRAAVFGMPWDPSEQSAWSYTRPPRSPDPG